MTRSKLFGSFVAFVTAVAFSAGTASAGGVDAKKQSGINTVVLIHGAWADGSSWQKVIPRLEAKGLHVVAVQLPLTTLADDVATVQRALALEAGPVLLVAHSFGGAVMTEAGNDPKVAGLVYVAAFAPQEGESAGDLAFTHQTPILEELRSDSFGFLKITPSGIQNDFAPDLNADDQALLLAVQKPTSLFGTLSAPITTPAWRYRPTWFVIAAQDRVVDPGLQMLEAERMNATTLTLQASHVAMLSHPEAVASFIRRAARQAGN